MPQQTRKHERHGTSVGKLERLLDAWPSRIAERVAERVRSARAARWRRRAAQSVTASEGESLAGRLSVLLRSGALESAMGAAERLAGDSGASSPGAVQLLVETWLMCGERARARDLARTNHAVLRRSDVGVGLLEALGLGDDELWLPGGRPNVVGIDRRLREGSMDAERLACAILSQPQALLRSAELLLLMHSALLQQEPERALRFFNRFLAVHGSPPLTSASGVPGGCWLSGLRAAVPAHRSGALVTVVVAARNAATTLGYAVESLLAQSYESLEILVCDDASDDETRRLLRERFRREPRVRAFCSSRQQGAYNVRNALLAEARGHLLTFHDADDFALPTRIADQVRCLARGGMVACVGNGLRVDLPGKPIFFKDMKATRLSPVSLMLTREALKACGPFQPVKVGGDAELQATLRARFGAAVGRLTAPLILSAWSPSSVTRSAGTEALEDGYRSPMRRAYSELVFRQHAAGFKPLSHAALLERLREMDNFIEPTEITAL